MLNPKHIVITGASSGLGAALADVYAAKGIVLSLQGRNEARLNRVAERAERRGARVMVKKLDVNDADGMSDWLLSCAALKPLDLVIANAGIAAGTGATGETEAQARVLFTTNLGGVLNTVHPVLPLMKARRRGQIALMSSLAGFRGLMGAPAYCASKAAVRVYGEGLRGEMQPHGVEVNVICPGYIRTPMTAKNPFPMPFLMPAGKAAMIIRRGLEANRARIAFPWPMAALVHLFSTVPQDWLDPLMARAAHKLPLE